VNPPLAKISVNINQACFTSGFIDSTSLTERILEITIPDGTDDIHITQRRRSVNHNRATALTVSDKLLLRAARST
jgi:hypothetical protein